MIPTTAKQIHTIKASVRFADRIENITMIMLKKQRITINISAVFQNFPFSKLIIIVCMNLIKKKRIANPSAMVL